MELPDDVLKIIREYAMPITMSDWKRGNYYNRNCDMGEHGEKKATDCCWCVTDIFENVVLTEDFNFYLNYIENQEHLDVELGNYIFVLDHHMSREEIRYELIGELKPNTTCSIHYSIETNNKTWIITNLSY